MDARYGVATQTRRHTFIASLLGIKHIVVAINKMDLVDYSEDVYQEIKNDYSAFSAKLDITDPRYLPLSALLGDNVVTKSENMPWYEGAPLMTMLENIPIVSDTNLNDFRFPVQYVTRPNLNFRGYCGTIASGTVKPGDKIIVLPSRKESRVKSIVTYEGKLAEAFSPQAVTLTLEDEIDVSRGDMVVHPNNVPYFTDRLDAQVVWMSETPMTPGNQYLIKRGPRKVSGTVANIRFKTEVNTLEQLQGERLNLNEIGRCELVLTQRIAFDAYKANRRTGSFIIIDRLTNVTVGAGMIVGAGVDTVDTWQAESRNEHLNPNDSLIAPAEGSAGSVNPKILLLTGLTVQAKAVSATHRTQAV